MKPFGVLVAAAALAGGLATVSIPATAGGGGYRAGGGGYVAAGRGYYGRPYWGGGWGWRGGWGYGWAGYPGWGWGYPGWGYGAWGYGAWGGPGYGWGYGAPQVVVSSPAIPFTYVERENTIVDAPANVAPAPPVTSAAPAGSWWYWCASAQGYYPYVDRCPEAWQRVTPQVPPR